MPAPRRKRGPNKPKLHQRSQPITRWHALPPPRIGVMEPDPHHAAYCAEHAKHVPFARLADVREYARAWAEALEVELTVEECTCDYACDPHLPESVEP